MRSTLLGQDPAIQLINVHARSRVRIVTPYFLPDETLIAALKVT